MREQLNPLCPHASDPSPDASISLGSLWGGLSGDRIPPRHRGKRKNDFSRAGKCGWLSVQEQRPARLSPAELAGLILSERGMETR